MATKDEVQAFLQNFKAKLSIWGIVFRDERGKNSQTLLTLEITPIYRESVLKELEIKDYCQGPLVEKLYGGADMWVFGKRIKQTDIYIKITLGLMGKQVICISFHEAEKALIYPFK